MDSLIKPIIEFLGPNFALVVGIAALVGLFVPVVARLFEFVRDVQSDKLGTAAKKSSLELLKLRYEIEAIKKEHELPTLPEESAVSMNVESAANTSPQSNAPARHAPWAWLAAIHRYNSSLAVIISVVSLISFGFISAFLFLFSFVGVIMEAKAAQPEWWIPMFLGAIALASLLISVSVAKQRARLRHLKLEE